MCQIYTLLVRINLACTRICQRRRRRHRGRERDENTLFCIYSVWHFSMQKCVVYSDIILQDDDEFEYECVCVNWCWLHAIRCQKWKNDLFEWIECERHTSATMVWGKKWWMWRLLGERSPGKCVSRPWFICDSNTRRAERKNRNENWCREMVNKINSMWNSQANSLFHRHRCAHPFSNQTFAAVSSSSSRFFVRCSVYRVLLSCFIACRMSTRVACVSDIERCDVANFPHRQAMEQQARSNQPTALYSVAHRRFVIYAEFFVVVVVVVGCRHCRCTLTIQFTRPFRLASVVSSFVPLALSRSLTTSDKHSTKFRNRSNCCDVHCMIASPSKLFHMATAMCALINKNK